MGWFFKNSNNPTDLLLKYEEEIAKLEYYILSSSSGSFPYRSLFVVLVVSFIFNRSYLYLPTWLFLPLVIFALYFYRYITRAYTNRQITKSREKLKNLKESQRSLINKFKKDMSYSRTRELLEKYENQEDRDTYFKKLKHKKFNSVDLFAVELFSPDPSKMSALICKTCGHHNGLIDPLNTELFSFHCYFCNTKNLRNVGSSSYTESDKEKKTE